MIYILLKYSTIILIFISIQVVIIIDYNILTLETLKKYKIFKQIVKGSLNDNDSWSTCNLLKYGILLIRAFKRVKKTIINKIVTNS